MMGSSMRGEVVARWAALALVCGAGLVTPAAAQLNEFCTVSVLNRNAPVNPDGTWTRDPFPSRVVPANRFDPVARKILSINPWVSPNAPGANSPTGPITNLITNENSRTLAVGLQSYATEQDVYWNQVMAASLVVSVPVVVGFLALQRRFVAGLTAGAVK